MANLVRIIVFSLIFVFGFQKETLAAKSIASGKTKWTERSDVLVRRKNQDRNRALEPIHRNPASKKASSESFTSGDELSRSMSGLLAIELIFLGLMALPIMIIGIRTIRISRG